MRYTGPNAVAVNEVGDHYHDGRLFWSVGGPDERDDVLILTDIRKAAKQLESVKFPTDVVIEERPRKTSTWGELLPALADELIYTPVWTAWAAANRDVVECVRVLFSNELRARFTGTLPTKFDWLITESLLNSLHW